MFCSSSNSLFRRLLCAENSVFLITTRCKHPLRADVSKYRPEVYKSEKSKILKKIHKVALGKLLT